MKRTLSILLILAVLLSCTVFFTGCSKDGGSDYPVTVGNITIDKEPENIVVLDDCLADIISFIGYDEKFAGRSADCDQTFMRYIPSVGSADSPDAASIVSAGADLVIASAALSDQSRAAIEEQGVTVIVLDSAAGFAAIKELYITLGTVLGGNSTGSKKGEKAYNNLADMLSQYKTAITGVVKTSVYLYLNENGQLCTFTKGSLQQQIFSYNGTMNALVNQTEAVVDETDLRLSTPTCIFYDDEAVLDHLRGSEKLSHLSALHNDKVCRIPLTSFYRYGTSCEDAVYQMVSFLNKSDEVPTDTATPDEATPDELIDEVSDEYEDTDYEESYDE